MIHCFMFAGGSPKNIFVAISVFLFDVYKYLLHIQKPKI